jgi:hypothetical protein
MELLSKGAVEALADVLSVDFGLKKLILESCGLDDDVGALPLLMRHTVDTDFSYTEFETSPSRALGFGHSAYT